MFEVRKENTGMPFYFFQYTLSRLAREMYDVPEVKEMYENRKDFDIFLVDELFSEVSV